MNYVFSNQHDQQFFASYATDGNCIRERSVIGLRDKSLSKCLRMKEELTLAECVKMVRRSEVTQDQLSIQAKSNGNGEVCRSE